MPLLPLVLALGLAAGLQDQPPQSQKPDDQQTDQKGDQKAEQKRQRNVKQLAEGAGFAGVAQARFTAVVIGLLAKSSFIELGVQRVICRPDQPGSARGRGTE